MARSDFAWVNFDARLTGSSAATRHFHVEGNPFGQGYLLIQGFDIERDNHQIEINGIDLPSFDIPKQGGNELWTTWMDRIPSGFLVSGFNRITIRQIGADSITIANVAVHWREAG